MYFGKKRTGLEKLEICLRGIIYQYDDDLLRECLYVTKDTLKDTDFTVITGDFDIVDSTIEKTEDVTDFCEAIRKDNILVDRSCFSYSKQKTSRCVYLQISGCFLIFDTNRNEELPIDKGEIIHLLDLAVYLHRNKGSQDYLDYKMNINSREDLLMELKNIGNRGENPKYCFGMIRILNMSDISGCFGYIYADRRMQFLFNNIVNNFGFRVFRINSSGFGFLSSKGMDETYESMMDLFDRINDTIPALMIGCVLCMLQDSPYATIYLAEENGEHLARNEIVIVKDKNTPNYEKKVTYCSSGKDFEQTCENPGNLLSDDVDVYSQADVIDRNDNICFEEE